MSRREDYEQQTEALLEPIVEKLGFELVDVEYVKEGGTWYLRAYIDGKADEGSLRGSSEIVAARIREEIQTKVTDAGLEIIEARITYLAYAPEIAAVMLQRQQASAIIDARKMIVDGAVGMVEMALDQLSEKEVVELDEERKAAMVSNLLVVLCGNHDTQPIINSGSLY